MKKTHLLIMSFLAAIFIAAGCNGSPQKAKADGADKKSAAMKAPAGQMGGTVLETMNSGGYTYVYVDTGSQKIWAAGPQTQVKVGDKVSMPRGMAMPNFHSKSLNRDFKTIYFVGAIMTGKGQGPKGVVGMTPPGQQAIPGMTPPGHPSTAAKKTGGKLQVKAGSIKKAKGGKTVAGIYKDKQKLAGKKVTTRGKVVKFTPQIMGKNWIHLQDGTGAPGSNDLTVTTAATPKKGDTVLISGVLAVDKDFGYGYKYAVIVEDATVKVE